MNSLFARIKRKYPFDLLGLKGIILTGLSIAIMMLAFKPFGFSNYEGNAVIAALGFGLLTAGCLLISNFVIKPLALKWRKGKWTILNEISYFLFLLILLSLVNLLFISFLSGQFHQLKGMDFTLWLKTMFFVLLATISIGIIPIAFIILLRYNRALKNNLSKIIRGEEAEKDSQQKKEVTFQSQNTSEKEFTIFLDDFLFLETVRNHVHIYYIEHDAVKTKILRNTITNIVESLNEEALFRCHRSFLINLNKIKTANGNSNGYKIQLKGYGPEIPVSRNFASEFQAMMY